MQEFLTLAHFNPDSTTQLSQTSQQYQRFQQALQQTGCRITKSYAALGRYDVVLVIEAKDIETVQVGLVAASKEWPIKTETLAVTPINVFIQTLDTAMSTPAGRSATR